MNQRILLPAFVLGGLFAIVLTFVQSLLPDATAAVVFGVDFVVLLTALTLYGVLMRRAADAAAQTPATSTARGDDRDRSRSSGNSGQSRDGSSTRGRGGRQGGGRERSRGRGEAQRGGRRGGQREDRPRDRDADAEARSDAPAGPREEGRIKWFSGAKGYGFVIRDDGSEIFVHHRAMRDRARRDIPDGQPVSFVIIERDKGPQADDVEVLGSALDESAA